MGIIFLTKPCHADRKNKGILTGKNVHPLFPLLFCAAEGKGGLQRGKREGGRRTGTLFPLCEHRHRDTGRTEHARFIIHKKRVKQT